MNSINYSQRALLDFSAILGLNSLHPSLISNLGKAVPRESRFNSPFPGSPSPGRVMPSPDRSSPHSLMRRSSPVCCEICHWQQCRGSGDGAICPWETQNSQVYQNLQVKANAAFSQHKHTDLFIFIPFTQTQQIHWNTNGFQLYSCSPCLYSLPWIFFCCFSSLLLHSLVKNWCSKALNQSQKFNLKFHVEPALKEHVSPFRAWKITKSIHLFPFLSPELSLAACESEV